MTTPKAHRGDLMLIMGILSVIVGPPIVSVIAWLMARNDLKAMDAGQMDPAGRSKTQVGMRLAIASTIGWPLLWGCCCTCLVGNQFIQGGRFVSAIGSRRITAQEFDRVQVGMTKKQITELLGPPAKTERSPGGTQIKWFWYERNGRSTFDVRFNSQDHVNGIGIETRD